MERVFNPEDLLLEVPDILPARPMIAQNLRLIFAHLLRDLGDDSIDRRVEIRAFMARLDGDVIVAMEDRLGEMPVLFHVENDVRFDNPRVIEMDVLELLMHIIVDRLGNADVAACDPNGNINVAGLHGCRLAGFAPGFFAERSSHLKAFAQINAAGDRIADQEFLGSLGFDATLEYEIGAIDNT